MNLTISPEAMQWFKKELVVDQGSGIRFFGKNLWQNTSA